VQRLHKQTRVLAAKGRLGEQLGTCAAKQSLARGKMHTRGTEHMQASTQSNMHTYKHLLVDADTAHLSLKSI